MISLERAVPQANAGQGEHSHVSQTTRDALRATLDPTYQWMVKEYGIQWQ